MNHESKNTHNIVAIISFQDESPPLYNINHLAVDNQRNEKARHLIASLTASVQGRLISQMHGMEVIQLPISGAEKLKEMNERLQEEFSIESTIGVGEDAEEALKAVNFAKENSPGMIRVYSVDMNKQPEDDIKEPSIEISAHDNLGKSDLAKAQHQIPVSKDQKLKIAHTLQQVAQNKELFEQLKQQSPDAYAGVVSVIQSLTLLLKQNHETHTENSDKLIEKINKELHKQKEKQDAKMVKEIQKELNRYNKEKDGKDKEKFDEWYGKHLEKRKARRALVRSNPEYNLIFKLLENK